jgi:uncharacterized protein (TIGR03086 family)
MDLIDLYDRGTAWMKDRIAGATDQLDATTPCDEWKVRDVINHALHGHEIFQGAARGTPVGPPHGMPPELIEGDPVEQYERGRQDTIAAFKEPGVLEKTGPTLGIAFVDTMIHAWDIAKGTGQDTAMPDDLAQAAFGMIDGRLPPEGSGDLFKPAVAVPDDAPAQKKLLGLTGRDPN